MIEYCERGSIYDHLRRKERFEVPIARTYFKMILSAIVYMLDAGVTHRDIKPDNIVLNSSFQLKIIDFGKSAFVSEDDPEEKGMGTEKDYPPEYWEGSCKPKGTDRDIFASAIVMFSLVVGIRPFEVAKPSTDWHYHHLALRHNRELYWGQILKVVKNYNDEIITD